MKEEYAKKIIKKNREAYDSISEHFSQTRSYLWEGLKQFSKQSQDGDKVLDFGCGNGRLLDIFKSKKIEYFGLDASEGLLREARERYKDELPEGVVSTEFTNISSLELPFENGFFDSVYSIAAVHHIPSRELRQKLLKEFKRVLKPNGNIVITNWNLWHGKYLSLIFKYALKKIIGQTNMNFGDILVPWKDQSGRVLAERYYHAFTKKEFKGLVQDAGFKIEKMGYFGGRDEKANLYIVAKKI